jgi:SHS2 domain-containing protein
MIARQKFRYLEHTADVLFEAFGSTFQEALENSALALFNTVGIASPKKSVEIETYAPTREQLVVYFLSDLLTSMDIKEMVFSSIKITELVETEGKFYVKAVAKGEQTQPRESVKAVTHHMLEVQQTSGGWRIQILLDV